MHAQPPVHAVCMVDMAALGQLSHALPLAKVLQAYGAGARLQQRTVESPKRAIAPIDVLSPSCIVCGWLVQACRLDTCPRRISLQDSQQSSGHHT